MRDLIVKELLELADRPYSKHEQVHEVNGHVIDFGFSQKMMYAVAVDNTYAQVHEHLLGQKAIHDADGEQLTEVQFILKKLGLEYTDIAY